jgi:DNA invertase Pin-like site-specific DNA recombinase
MSTIYGYARVSTGDQDLTVQEEALKRAGCRVIRKEKKSGTSRKGRTELQTLMEFMQEGDVLVVTRIDRLARSMRDLQNIVHELQGKGIQLRATEQPVDTTTAAGKAFLDMLGVFAEFETNLRRERQMEGIARIKADPKARAAKYKGRPGKADPDDILAAHGEGKSVLAIARELNIGRSTVYDVLRREGRMPMPEFMRR